MPPGGLIEESQGAMGMGPHGGAAPEAVQFTVWAQHCVS